MPFSIAFRIVSDMDTSIKARRNAYVESELSVYAALLPNMKEAELKVYENRLRRMAQRQGLKLIKSRRRDPNATDYGCYWIVRPENDSGHWRSKTLMSCEYGIGLTDVHRYLLGA